MLLAHQGSQLGSAWRLLGSLAAGSPHPRLLPAAPSLF